MFFVSMDPGCRIHRYTHFFKVLQPNSQIRSLTLQFAYRYTHKGVTFKEGRAQTEVLNTYAAKTADDTEYRFHIGQYQEYIQLLERNGVGSSHYTVEDKAVYEGESISLKVRDNFQLYDYQLEAKEFSLTFKASHPTGQAKQRLAEPGTANFSRLITFPMGRGKTKTALSIVAEKGQRVLVAVLAKYTDKWAKDITETIDCSPKQVMVLKGSKDIQGIIAAAKEGKSVCPFTVVSLTTLRNFIKAYETNPANCVSEQEYGCSPEEFYQVLGIGSVIIDECHEQLYTVFKTMLYMHVPLLIALSATFIDREDFIKRIQALMFPTEIRFDKVKMKKYINVRAIAYTIQNFQYSRVQTTEYGQNQYSHVAFERSILNNKNKNIRKSYLDLIRYHVKVLFEENYMPGDKLAIYAASIDMCEAIVADLKKHYPQRDIRKYTQEDPFENVIEAEVRVTTLLSGGTAIDIPGLRVAINTVSIQSPRSNLQVLGRLRELKDRDVTYCYLYCEQIPKQVEYHLEKKPLFLDWTNAMHDSRSPCTVHV